VDSEPEPVVSSDSDVEMVGDPVVEQREWRLRKAATGDRIPPRTVDVKAASPESRDTAAGAELQWGHAEAVCRVPGPGDGGGGAAAEEGIGGAVTGQAAPGP